MKKNPVVSYKSVVRKNLRFSFFDGLFACIMTGLTQDYFTPFLILLGGNAWQVGIMAAAGNFLSAFVQLKSPDLTARVKSRKKIVTIFVLMQAVVILPMIYMAVMKVTIPFFFLLLAALFTAFAAITVPPWGSMMSDLIPSKKRGYYFGWRNRTLGFVTVSFSLIAGIVLSVMKKIDIFYGFGIIFCGAVIARFLSWYNLEKMKEPRLEYKKDSHFTIFDFIRGMRTRNFARFALFVGLMNFCVFLASPFFPVLMIRDLKFSYITYTVINVTATITGYVFMKRWGQHADKVGNLRVIRFAANIISILPLLWVINRNPIYLIFAQIISGFAWAGFNLCTTNFVYDAVTPEKRTRCLAYLAVVTGTAICCGSLIGGVLSTCLPPLFGYRILSVCLLSTMLRFSMAFFFPIKIREVRKTEHMTNLEILFSVTGIKYVFEVVKFNR
ncbi:MAG TPA: MFS transporter [Candidatus Omnitrophota bacterium]|nr:MFS transporter [Candidatus Omnitrophota bacterium]HPS20107.1 MFS transporter [Candidatus Omnitrophota bacterium]